MKANPIVSMDKLDLASIKTMPPRQFGKAKLVFLEPKITVVTPELQQAWPLRPASDDGEDKFSLEVSVGSAGSETETEALFKNAITAFDMRIRQMAFKDKKSWFGKDSDGMTSEADLRLVHTLSVKKGNEKQDGSRYFDTVKFKVTGWKDFVDEVVYRGEGDKKFPSDVRWKSRIVNAQGQGGPDEKQTKFYICENTDPTTGKKQMVPWTPCQDPAGNEIKDSLGNTMYEFVGPKHCQPGSTVRVVFKPSMVWLSSKFGVTLQASQVFITPAAPKAKSAIDGIEIKDFVDPVLAKKAARLAMASNDLREIDFDGLDDAGQSASPEVESDARNLESSLSASMVPLEPETKSPKKRAAEADKADKADKTETSKAGKKKVKLDEEF